MHIVYALDTQPIMPGHYNKTANHSRLIKLYSEGTWMKFSSTSSKITFTTFGTFFLALCREDNTGSHERIISNTFSQIQPVWLCLTCQTWCPSMPQASYLIPWQKYLRHLKKHQRTGTIKSQVTGRTKLNFRVIWHLEAIHRTTKYPYQLSVAMHVILTSRCNS